MNTTSSGVGEMDTTEETTTGKKTGTGTITTEAKTADTMDTAEVTTSTATDVVAEDRPAEDVVVVIRTDMAPGKDANLPQDATDGHTVLTSIRAPHHADGHA